MKTKLSGAERIAKERQRQIEKEGWTAEHDDNHDGAEMAMAAACYAAPENIYIRHDYAASVEFRDPWPWEPLWDRRNYPNGGNVVAPEPSLKKRIRQLEKAGALIAAEIDRLVRERERLAASSAARERETSAGGGETP